MVIDVFYIGRKHRTNAVGVYNTDTGKVTVFQGSIVSESIAQFPRSETIKKFRDEYTNEKGIVLQNITFNSPSLAAMFVCGFSINGLLGWHVEKNKNLKTLLQERAERLEKPRFFL